MMFHKQYFLMIFHLSNHIRVLDGWSCGNSTQKCGYILDGTPASLEDFPHAVAVLGDEYRYICGGSAFKENIIITAAHCVFKANVLTEKYTLDIIAGNVDYHHQSAEHRKVMDSVCHPCFTWENIHNDIALLFLKEDLPIGDIQLVRIERNWPANVKTANVSGWGVDSDKHIARYLNYVEMKVYTHNKCCIIMCHLSIGLHLGEICSGDRHSTVPTRKPFRGDSRGAFMVQGNLQIGLVSSSLEERPGVEMFTNVTFYFDWIMKTINRS